MIEDEENITECKRYDNKFDWMADFTGANIMGRKLMKYVILQTRKMGLVYHFHKYYFLLFLDSVTINSG